MVQSPTTHGSDSAQSPEQFLEKLKSALRRNGDFPASAKIVCQLRQLTSETGTTAAQVAEVILQEPSLGVRVLHLVNSSFYRRAKPVTTISQAVIHVGMKPLAEMCAGLVLLQRFVSESRRNSVFALRLRRCIVASLLTSSITLETTQITGASSASQKASESGYLAGTIAELGVLLMAYYFPQVYDSAIKRSEAKHQSISASIKQISGLSPAELSVEVCKTLDLPHIFGEIVLLSECARNGTALTHEALTPDLELQSRSLASALWVCDVLDTAQSEHDISSQIPTIAKTTGVPPVAILQSLQTLPMRLGEHYETLELSLPKIPFDLKNLTIDPNAKVAEPAGITGHPALDQASSSSQPGGLFADYVHEIKQALENQEPATSIIVTAMEACAFCLGFDRVLLLLAINNRKSLVGKMMIGTVPGIEPTKISRPIGDDHDQYAPDNMAFMKGQPVFTGEPIFKDGWPIAALPVGTGKRSIGVVYAERVGSHDNEELSASEQAAIQILTELLDRAVQRG